MSSRNNYPFGRSHALMHRYAGHWQSDQAGRRNSASQWLSPTRGDELHRMKNYFLRCMSPELWRTGPFRPLEGDDLTPFCDVPVARRECPLGSQQSSGFHDKSVYSHANKQTLVGAARKSLQTTAASVELPRPGPGKGEAARMERRSSGSEQSPTEAHERTPTRGLEENSSVMLAATLAIESDSAVSRCGASFYRRHAARCERSSPEYLIFSTTLRSAGNSRPSGLYFVNVNPRSCPTIKAASL
jgi:hypothetical protein